MFDSIHGNGAPASLLSAGRARPGLVDSAPQALCKADGFSAAPPFEALAAMHEAEPPERLGFALRMEEPALLLGLGTTGTKIAHGVVARVCQELGRRSACMNYLAIDGASKDFAAKLDHFVCIDVHGCGTDPRRAVRQFYRHYQEIRCALDRQMLTVSQFDPEIPVFQPPQEILAVWIFAGCGGTSGGTLHPAISLLHDLAQHRRIRNLRVHVVLMGPEMPMRDCTRGVHPKQVAVVADTFFGNLQKIIADMCSAAVLVEKRPDGSTFRLAAADRVWGLQVRDQSNGSFDWSTTDELIEMISWECFLQIFTQLGNCEENRKKDLEELNISARRILEGTNP